VVMVAAVSAAAGVIAVSATGGSLTWPAGELGWPPVQVPVLALLALLAVPAARPRRVRGTTDPAQAEMTGTPESSKGHAALEVSR
jgi:hypothetical protein